MKKKDKELYIKFYQEMQRLRSFELKASELFTQAMLAGNIHTYIGQEAVAVGACNALKESDYIVCTHRGHGQCIARGCKPNLMMAELFGKQTGYCKGKGGSMHIADLNRGILGANGIVGAGLAIGTGSGLASKITEKNEVTLVFFGDGASNEGYFHESINMASAWKLPVVYLCENNKYGVSVCIDRVCNVEDIAERAKAYNIPGMIVDGNNVFEIYNAVQKAAEHARQGKGPSLIEAKTYRYHGHYEGDPQVYKSKTEIEKWLNHDAIENIKKEILSKGFASEEELKIIEEKNKAEIEEAVAFAKDSPYPDVREVTDDVYTTDNERGVVR